MPHAWLQLGPRRIEVALSDPCLLQLLDLIPLIATSVESPEPPLAILKVRMWADEDRQSLPGHVVVRGHRELALPSQPEFGPDATVWLSEREVVMLVPGHGYAVCAGQWNQADIRVATASTWNAGALLAAVVQAVAAHHGYFATHASVVEREGVGVVFCGAPGQGKSSCCLALGRAGWTVLADDRCYLHRQDARLALWGPGGEMRLRADAPQLWGDVREAMAQGIPWGTKTRVALDSVVPSHGAGDAIPAAIFFPRIGAERHRIEPLDAAAALPELLRVSGLASLPAHAARQFELTAELLNCTPCYRLHLAPDMSLLPTFIAEILA